MHVHVLFLLRVSLTPPRLLIWSLGAHLGIGRLCSVAAFLHDVSLSRLSSWEAVILREFPLLRPVLPESTSCPLPLSLLQRSLCPCGSQAEFHLVLQTKAAGSSCHCGSLKCHFRGIWSVMFHEDTINLSAISTSNLLWLIHKWKCFSSM